MKTTGLSLQSDAAAERAEVSGSPATPSAHRPTVCHVVHGLGVGGAEMLVADMIRGLSSEFRGVVACLDEVGSIGEALRADGVPLTLLSREPGIDWRCSRRLARWCAEQSVDVLHAHQCTPMFQAMLARLPWRRIPLLLTEHGRHHPDLPSRRRSLCHRLLLSRRDRLVAVGNATREALICNEGLPQDRVEVVYNGVDLARYRDPDPGARAAVREELRLPADALVMTLVARLDPIKDHATAIDVLRRVRERCPNARLLLVGDGPARAEIEAKVLACGLGDAVCLAGTRSDVASVLAASDVFLMTSLGEGIPLTVIEAMAAGVPVVSTDVGGLPEMIDHQQTGFLHAAEAVDDLAASVVQLHENPEPREAVVQRARQRAFAMFDRTAMLGRYRAIYQGMLHGR